MVGLAAVTDAGDVDGVVAGRVEEEAVVAAAERDVDARRFELLGVSGTHTGFESGMVSEGGRCVARVSSEMDLVGRPVCRQQV